jgi:sec-independent protein translocase protein TatA
MSPLPLGMLNTPEIILILVLALVLFGAKKLPELARGLGHGIKEFKKATRDVQDELSSAMNAEPPPPPISTPPPAPEPSVALSSTSPAPNPAPVEGEGSADTQPPSEQPKA